MKFCLLRESVDMVAQEERKMWGSPVLAFGLNSRAVGKIIRTSRPQWDVARFELGSLWYP